MNLHYQHLCPDAVPPVREAHPYRAILVIEEEVSQEWRNEVAKWLVESGCLYLVAWGVDCEGWHDTVDWTNLEAFDFGDIPDDKFIMTTWHDKEPLSEAFWFCGNCASHPDVYLSDTVIVHIAREERGVAILEDFSNAQVMDDEA